MERRENRTYIPQHARPIFQQERIAFYALLGIGRPRTAVAVGASPANPPERLSLVEPSGFRIEAAVEVGKPCSVISVRPSLVPDSVFFFSALNPLSEDRVVGYIAFNALISI